MKIVKLIALLVVAYFGYDYYQNNIAFDHPIAGSWISDRDKSMKYWYKKGVTAEQEAFLKNVLGKMTIDVRKKYLGDRFRRQNRARQL